MTYYDIFEEMIGKHLRNAVLYEYDTVNKNHEYHPFRHSCVNLSEVTLANLMEKYIYFYAYAENEIVNAYESGRLEDLKKASKFALKSRLPNRKGAQNGIYSELLLELLITLQFPEANKLATRAIYRQQSDNNEIKGFDGLHIRFLEEKTEVWLGQAKMGSRYYSIKGIKEDLYDKMNMLYTSEQLFFVADKETKVSTRALEFLGRINDISCY